MKLSYWAYRIFTECPLRYKFLVLDGIRAKTNQRNALLGTALHMLIENHFRYGKSSTWIVINVDRYFFKALAKLDNLKWKNDFDQQTAFQKAREMADNMKDFLDANPYVCNRGVIIEHSIYAPLFPDIANDHINFVTIGGKPDIQLIDEDLKTIEVWDLKAVEDKSRLDHIQLYFYSHILRQLKPDYKVKTLFVTPLLRNEPTVPYSLQNEAEYFSRVQETWNAIKSCRKAQTYPAKESPACRYCEFRREHCKPTVQS